MDSKYQEAKFAYTSNNEIYLCFQSRTWLKLLTVKFAHSCCKKKLVDFQPKKFYNKQDLHDVDRWKKLIKFIYSTTDNF